MAKAKVGIINVTGYTGVELARLLSRHPQVELVSVTGRSTAGQNLASVFPQLDSLNLEITPKLSPDVELAFSALPHKESAAIVAPLIKQGVKVVDLSADFRLRKAGLYPEWYDFTHPAPGLLGRAVYGLPELYRPEIVSAELVANPGCYPTASILALAPAAKAGIIGGNIIVDAKSGVSGAGRSLNMVGHYAEANEDTVAYALSGHRHLPEIIQEVEALGGTGNITFVPHLVPMTRGILATCYIEPARKITQAEVTNVYRQFYKEEPFVKVTDTPPHTKHTWGANFCLVHPVVDTRTGRLVVISCIDNLVKGAAGQAIQNMNLMLGLPETTGLEAHAVYP